MSLGGTYSPPSSPHACYVMRDYHAYVYPPSLRTVCFSLDDLYIASGSTKLIKIWNRCSYSTAVAPPTPPPSPHTLAPPFLSRFSLQCVGGRGGWSWGESGVGEWARLVVGVGLNSRGGDAQSILPHAGNLDVMRRGENRGK